MGDEDHSNALPLNGRTPTKSIYIYIYIPRDTCNDTILRISAAVLFAVVSSLTVRGKARSPQPLLLRHPEVICQAYIRKYRGYVGLSKDYNANAHPSAEALFGFRAQTLSTGDPTLVTCPVHTRKGKMPLSGRHRGNPSLEEAPR